VQLNAGLLLVVSFLELFDVKCYMSANDYRTYTGLIIIETI
jgi:hypothetical protein